MPRKEPPTGLPLTAQPPLYQFTNSSDKLAWSNAAVFLFDLHGKPHWFASDGYSAMLTPALLEGEGDLFPPKIGDQYRVYPSEHIKTLFKYVKGKYVLLEQATGTLLSPDGLVRVPAFEYDTEEGEAPDTVPLPDVHAPFEGAAVEESTFSFDLKFVSAIRSAFSHTTKEAGLELTSLEGQRVLLEVGQPYVARILIALSDAAPLHEEEPEGSLVEKLTDLPGVESVTLTSGGQSVTLTADMGKKAKKLRQQAEREARL
ncbi:hypothetical protein [Deinococcus sp. Leaf326]|uniref:hypothetical protein n=1 Tax=Deinococcus sp. Leaf326 TaxID=1736338 RepID=UPI0006F28F08|nr:hypothetical protein [Deinococcus sp. Leaf326]KQR33152.1 hypothetical protein ASF71_16815 [Deinococcus sp. Leaf326]